MSATAKAKRESVAIGSLSVEGFQMPDGSYRMSLSSAADAVGLQARNAFDFLRSKAAERLLGSDSTLSVAEVEVESPPEQTTGQTRIRAIPLNVVARYWLWQTSRGNKQALVLVDALLEESLERRFDDAFGVARTEYERQERLTERMRILEQEFQTLSEAYSEPEDLKEQITRLEDQLRQNGIEPWQIGGGDRL
ncbi:MAG: hypothetical protein AAGE59_36950 [Cyanobacteria bacterium P01_F01_bin.86]